MSAYDSGDDDPELAAALALSMQVESNVSSSEENDSKPEAVEDFSEVLESAQRSKAPFAIASFHEIMWDSAVTTDSDKQRWVGQGIHVSEEPEKTDAAAAAAPANPTEAASHESVIDQLAATCKQWGLVQSQGGPCGVLAVIQAELLRILLWGRRSVQRGDVCTIDYPTISDAVEAPPSSVVPLSPDLIQVVLAKAIAMIIARATLTGPAYEAGDDEKVGKARIVLPHDSDGQPLRRDLTWDDLEKSLAVYTIDFPEPVSGVKRQKRDDDGSLEERVSRVSKAISAFLLASWKNSYIPLESFRRNGGVLLLTMSIVASRGKDRIQKEFDDSASPRLTAQFGHCGQELMNVMLTGRAVSNVFDNTMSLGEMVCKGIHTQSSVGYLSQLESLRYCEVGSFLKSPKFAVWVCGSTSHFTVLFGDSRALKESKSDRLLETCQRAFKMVEGGEENGFIQVDQLGQVLKTLELDVGGEPQVQAFAASLEVSGAGIILWDSFWKATSRLMTGATLESVIQGENGDLANLDDTLMGENLVGTEVTTAVLDGPPRMPQRETPNTAQRETDEQMARRLADEWGEWNPDKAGTGIDTLAQVATSASPVQENSTGTGTGTAQMSDEELARKLQAQFDNEGNGTNSVAATSGSPPPPLIPSDPDEQHNLPEDSKPSAGNDAASTFSSLDFERFGDSFPLCHYNGLRGGTLTRFRVTRLSAVEAVGASTALNNGGQSGSGDLEDVVRTKYPSCAVNWLGKQPPFID